MVKFLFPPLNLGAVAENSIQGKSIYILGFKLVEIKASLPEDVLWGSFVTHSFLPHGRLLNIADIYVHQSQAVYGLL